MKDGTRVFSKAFVCMLSYILTISASVRLPRDQAALARTFGDRSSRAARIVFAVSATNITSWERENRSRFNGSSRVRRVRRGAQRGLGCPYLSQTGEQDVDSQSPDGRRLHQIVLTVGQAQQHSDAHHLGLVLKKEKAKHHTYGFTTLGVSRVGTIQEELTGSCAKACGRMEDSVSQALVCSVGCCSLCSAAFRGPLNTSDQNRTTCIVHKLMDVKRL